MSRTLLAVLLMSCGCNGQLRFEDGAAAASAEPRCQNDSHCGDPALHCDVVSHHCVACRTDNDCSAGGAPRCDLALHRCVECGANIDCASGSSCEATTRRCVIECAEGITEHVCPATAPTCDEVAGFCVRCSSDLDCRQNTDDGIYCDPANGRCVFCVEDDQCTAALPRCDRTRGRCSGCIDSADCPTGQFCNPERMQCVPA
jgi:Cys-rich repeat protein